MARRPAAVFIGNLRIDTYEELDGERFVEVTLLGRHSSQCLDHEQAKRAWLNLGHLITWVEEE